MCGGIFCSKCSPYRELRHPLLDQYDADGKVRVCNGDDDEEVRVCDTCYAACVNPIPADRVVVWQPYTVDIERPEAERGDIKAEAEEGSAVIKAEEEKAEPAVTKAAREKAELDRRHDAVKLAEQFALLYQERDKIGDKKERSGIEFKQNFVGFVHLVNNPPQWVSPAKAENSFCMHESFGVYTQETMCATATGTGDKNHCKMCSKTMCEPHIKRCEVSDFSAEHVVFKLFNKPGDKIKFCHDCYRKIETCNDWLVKIVCLDPFDFLDEKDLDSDFSYAEVDINNAISLRLERSCVEAHMHALQTSARAYLEAKADLAGLEDKIKSAMTDPAIAKLFPERSAAEGGRRQMSVALAGCNIMLPGHWVTNGNPRSLSRVTGDGELKAVTAPLEARLGQYGLQIKSVERVEHARLWGKYRLERDAVYGQTGDANERWLWHGTSATDEVLANGFDNNYTSLKFNKYGAGIYFAPDPRLSDFFIRSARLLPTAADRRILLCRVACGSIGQRSAIPNSEMDAALKEIENRTAPAGHNSATGGDHTEVIVHQNDKAYPAYVVTYNVSKPLPNPYTQARAEPGYLLGYENVEPDIFPTWRRPRKVLHPLIGTNHLRTVLSPIPSRTVSYSIACSVSSKYPHIVSLTLSHAAGTQQRVHPRKWMSVARDAIETS